MRPISKREVRRRARAIVRLRLAIAGGVVGGAVVGAVARMLSDPFGHAIGPRADGLLIACATVSTTVLAFVALAPPKDGLDVPQRDLARTLVAAIANVPACLAVSAVLSCLDGAPPAGAMLLLPIVLAVCTIPGLVLSVPLGLVYGAVHALALAALRRELRASSRAALVRARALGIGACVLGQVMLVLAGGCAVGCDGIVLAEIVALQALALADFVALEREAGLVRRFKARMRRDPSMRIVPIADARVNPSLAPLDDAPTLAVVDARVVDPYRERPWAIALVRQG